MNLCPIKLLPCNMFRMEKFMGKRNLSKWRKAYKRKFTGDITWAAGILWKAATWSFTDIICHSVLNRCNCLIHIWFDSCLVPSRQILGIQHSSPCYKKWGFISFILFVLALFLLNLNLDLRFFKTQTNVTLLDINQYPLVSILCFVKFIFCFLIHCPWFSNVLPMVTENVARITVYAKNYARIHG